MAWYSGMSSGWSDYTSSGDFYSTMINGILSGVAASSEASENRRNTEEDYRFRRELAQMELEGRERLGRISGDEDRRTIDFQSRLTESQRLNERARLGKAWDAWGSGSSAKPAAQPVTAPNFNDYYVAPPVKPPTQGR